MTPTPAGINIYREILSVGRFRKDCLCVYCNNISPGHCVFVPFRTTDLVKSFLTVAVPFNGCAREFKSASGLLQYTLFYYMYIHTYVKCRAGGEMFCK